MPESSSEDSPRGLSPIDKSKTLADIVDEFTKYKEDPNSPLKNGAEWANDLGITRSSLNYLLSQNASNPIIAERAKVLKAIGALHSGQASREKGTGLFGTDPKTGEKLYVEGRSLGGRAAVEQKTGIHGMTAEERTEVGRRSGLNQAAEGIGMFGQTKEQMTQRSSKGGSTTKARSHGVFGRTDEEMKSHGRRVGQIVYEKGVGIFARSPEQRQRDAITASEAVGSQKVIYGENYYDSYMEATTATLLEKYIPNFRIERGKTYQVAEGLDKKIDFFINGVFVEYNPIIFAAPKRGSFETIEEYSAFKVFFDCLPLEERQQYLQDTHKHLKEQYYQKRKAALDKNPAFKNNELLIVTTPEELYDQVIVRFGMNIPEKDLFKNEFTSMQAAIKSSINANRQANMVA